MIKKLLDLAAICGLLTGSLAFGTAAADAVSVPAPFRASFSGSAAITGPTATAFSGTGQATLMGRITTQGHADITGSDSSCPGGVANTNVEALTAADGDMLTITSQDVACPTGGSNQYHGTGRWTVAAGTGRFANATGHGSYDGSADFDAGTFTITLNGTLAGAVPPAGHQTPFTATIAGRAVLTSPSTGTFTGLGLAVPLGPVRTSGGVLALFIPDGGCPNGFKSINTETFTAIGGTLSITSDDVTCPTGAPNQYRGTGNWAVTGGTGRVAGATGQGTYSGFADFDAQRFRFVFSGTISTPHDYL